MKKNFLYAIILLSIFMFLGCPMDSWYTYDTETIDTIELLLEKTTFAPNETCAVEISGTLANYFENTRFFCSLYKKNKSSYELWPIYYKNSELEDKWIEKQFIEYHINEEEYDNIKRRFLFIVDNSGDYKLSLNVFAKDKTKEETLRDSNKYYYFTVSE